jgi:hypothetical protein
MNYSSITTIIQQGLHQYIDSFQSQLNQIGCAITEDYFNTQLPDRNVEGTPVNAPVNGRTGPTSAGRPFQTDPLQEHSVQNQTQRQS